MIELSLLTKTLNITVDLLVLALSLGLVFSLLVQPRRDRSNLLFAGFCLSLGFWALTALSLSAPEIELSISTDGMRRLQATAILMTVAVFFFFVVVFSKPEGSIAAALLFALPVWVLAALVLTWTGQVFSIDAVADKIDIKPAGYVLFAIALAYLLLAFWIIISSRDANARMLRVPSVLLVLALLTNWIDALHLAPLLVAGAAVWIGWSVLRFQVFNPLNELNRELRITNRDLQQVISDLAAEKQKSEELNRELRSANQFKSEFLANMSHELRTPLNSIIGYAELLRGGLYGQLNEKQSDRLEKIHRNGANLLELITDILDLNKIDAGKLKLDIVSFELAPLVDKLAQDARTRCADKGLALDIDVSAELPRLYGDDKRILQVFDNLIDNAIKFTTQGRVSIVAKAVRVKHGMTPDFKLPALGWLRDGDWIITSVGDTGIGIPIEEQGRIFDEFAQVDGSRTREYGGTGLGLAISKRLVEMHDGVIWVKSLVDEGSTFFVALPTDFKVSLAGESSTQELNRPQSQITGDMPDA